MPLKAVLAGAIHRGHVRPGNEDRVVLDRWTTGISGTLYVQPAAVLERPVLVAVLDGMGGHPGGALAAQIAATALAEATAEVRPGEGAQALPGLVRAGADAVAQLAAGLPGHATMGTTVAGVLVDGGWVEVFNVGDSRVYRLSGEYLGQLSVDDRIRTSGLTQALGGPAGRPLDIHHHRIEVDLEETLLVCSDGVHDVLPAEVIAQAIGVAGAGGALRRLIGAALEAGAPDNVSAALVRLSPA